jgi:hypothetical protein
VALIVLGSCHRSSCLSLVKSCPIELRSYRGAGRRDGRPRLVWRVAAPAPVIAEIVEDDDIALGEGWDEHILNAEGEAPR